MIIVTVSLECERNGINVSDDAVAARIRSLVDDGKLQSQGSLSRWRHSEVKLPD
jgi:hypothetical protein